MTKEEAKQAMSEGKKITHRYFMEREWAQQQEVNLQHGTMIITGDGIKRSWLSFWNNYITSPFDTGWELYKD